MTDKVFLDTNVLVYAHDEGAPEKRDRSRQLIFESMRNGSGVISAQVLSEFFVTVTRKAQVPMTADRAKKEIVLLSTMETIDVDSTLVVRAVDMAERWRVSYWDALVLAAAERAGCRTLYSEDLADGQSYGSVTVRNPYPPSRLR